MKKKKKGFISDIDKMYLVCHFLVISNSSFWLTWCVHPNMTHPIQLMFNISQGVLSDEIITWFSYLPIIILTMNTWPWVSASYNIQLLFLRFYQNLSICRVKPPGVCSTFRPPKNIHLLQSILFIFQGHLHHSSSAFFVLWPSLLLHTDQPGTKLHDFVLLANTNEQHHKNARPCSLLSLLPVLLAKVQ